MEEHAEDPSGHANVSEEHVVFPQRIGGRNAIAKARKSGVMGEEVEEGEDDTEGFLHAEESVKGPFPVEL